jgi:hypothetical protein
MKLNYSGKLARFYRWSFDSDVPSNLCTLFWGLLFATLFFPITWASLPFDCSNFVERIVKGFIVLGGLVLAGLFLTYLWLVPGFFFIPALVVGGILLVICLIFLIGFVCTEILPNSTTWQEVKDVVRERKDGFKGRYCPKVEWKYEWED